MRIINRIRNKARPHKAAAVSTGDAFLPKGLSLEDFVTLFLVQCGVDKSGIMFSRCTPEEVYGEGVTGQDSLFYIRAIRLGEIHNSPTIRRMTLRDVGKGRYERVAVDIAGPLGSRPDEIAECTIEDLKGTMMNGIHSDNGYGTGLKERMDSMFRLYPGGYELNYL